MNSIVKWEQTKIDETDKKFIVFRPVRLSLSVVEPLFDRSQRRDCLRGRLTEFSVARITRPLKILTRAHGQEARVRFGPGDSAEAENDRRRSDRISPEKRPG
jgi:hypothetical protein